MPLGIPLVAAEPTWIVSTRKTGFDPEQTSRGFHFERLTPPQLDHLVNVGEQEGRCRAPWRLKRALKLGATTPMSSSLLSKPLQSERHIIHLPAVGRGCRPV
jgi:hypothetical protein